MNVNLNAIKKEKCMKDIYIKREREFESAAQHRGIIEEENRTVMAARAPLRV